VVAVIIEIDVSRLSDYARARLVQGVVDRYGLAGASKLLRHYIQYLFFKRVISGETCGWIIEYVPSRSYNLKASSFRAGRRSGL
jgi:hypothetical protein